MCKLAESTNWVFLVTTGMFFWNQQWENIPGFVFFSPKQVIFLFFFFPNISLFCMNGTLDGKIYISWDHERTWWVTGAFKAGSCWATSVSPFRQNALLPSTFMNFRSWESLVHLLCMSLDCEERVPASTKEGRQRGGGPPSPSWGFVPVKRRKALATFDITFSADHGWGQKQYIMFFFTPSCLLNGNARLQRALSQSVLLFHNKPMRFQLVRPHWTEAPSRANSKHFACALFLTFKTTWRWKWIPIRAAGTGAHSAHLGSLCDYAGLNTPTPPQTALKIDLLTLRAAIKAALSGLRSGYFSVSAGKDGNVKAK